MEELSSESGLSQRGELAQFLRASRSRLAPEQGSVWQGRRRRVKGLRREEVAELAGIGVAWYTWLEQARPVNVSPTTLARVADALQLQPQERSYIFQLAGLGLPRTPVQELPDLEPLKKVVTTLDPSPALLLDACWMFSLGIAQRTDCSDPSQVGRFRTAM